MRKLQIAILLNSLLPLNAVNVLLFLIGTTPWERSTFEFLAQQLAIRGHRTITVKAILIPEEPKLVRPKLHLVHEKTLKNLLPRKLFEPLLHIGDTIPWKENYDVEEHLLPYYAAHNHSCYKMLNSDLMENLRRENIDVAIIYSGNPCQLAFVHLLNIPFIYFDMDGFSDESRVASGTPLDFDVPSSACPDSSYAKSFIERLQNAYCIMPEYITQYGPDFVGTALSVRHRLLDFPIQRLFNDNTGISNSYKPFPSLHEIKRKAELFFINTDPVLEYPVALPPHVIHVGGLHIDDSKPLFAPWNETIKSAPKGVIVVSLGNVANPSKMKVEQAEAMLKAFSRLTEYHIYWSVGPNLRLPNISVSDVPSHISLMAYIPQNDLLAQKRTRLLVTNGGINSILEALAQGIPMVGIPLMGANKHNLNKVLHNGFGVIIQKNQLMEQTLYSAIKEVLDNPKYGKNARAVKKLWHQRKTKPLETAIRWIEHVGRHGVSRAKFIEPVSGGWDLVRHTNIDIITALVMLLISPLLIALMFFHALNSIRKK